MPRLPDLTRDAVPDELREAFDVVMAANDGQPIGPGSITIHSPEMARRRMPISKYMRSEIGVSPRIVEVAILTTARCLNCPFVWNAHAPLARKAGVADGLVDALRDRKPLPAMPADESAIVQYGTELLQTHRVSEQTFKAALDQFGAQHLVELTTLMGHYAQNCFLVNAFAVDMPDELSEPVLPV